MLPAACTNSIIYIVLYLDYLYEEKFTQSCGDRKGDKDDFASMPQPIHAELFSNKQTLSKVGFGPTMVNYARPKKKLLLNVCYSS